jgi:hypothetical protein
MLDTDDSCIPKPKNCGSEVDEDCQEIETVSQYCASVHKTHIRCGELCLSSGMSRESCTRNGGAVRDSHDDNP